MIGREGQGKHGPDGGFPFEWNNAIRDVADCQDGGLRWNDDRAERIYVVHTEIADRESSPSQICLAQLAGSGAFGQVLAMRRNLTEIEAVCARNHRRNHAIFHRHGEADIHVRVVVDAVAHPACVDARMPRKNPRDQRNQ